MFKLGNAKWPIHVKLYSRTTTLAKYLGCFHCWAAYPPFAAELEKQMTDSSYRSLKISLPRSTAYYSSSYCKIYDFRTILQHQLHCVYRQRVVRRFVRRSRPDAFVANLLRHPTVGVERNASEDELERAYRKNAMKWHPDKNPDDKVQAENSFRNSRGPTKSCLIKRNVWCITPMAIRLLEDRFCADISRYN